MNTVFERPYKTVLPGPLWMIDRNELRTRDVRRWEQYEFLPFRKALQEHLSATAKMQPTISHNEVASTSKWTVRDIQQHRSFLNQKAGWRNQPIAQDWLNSITSVRFLRSLRTLVKDHPGHFECFIEFRRRLNAVVLQRCLNDAQNPACFDPKPSDLSAERLIDIEGGDLQRPTFERLLGFGMQVQSVSGTPNEKTASEWTIARTSGDNFGFINKYGIIQNGKTFETPQLKFPLFNFTIEDMHRTQEWCSYPYDPFRLDLQFVTEELRARLACLAARFPELLDDQDPGNSYWAKYHGESTRTDNFSAPPKNLNSSDSRNPQLPSKRTCSQSNVELQNDNETVATLGYTQYSSNVDNEKQPISAAFWPMPNIPSSSADKRRCMRGRSYGSPTGMLVSQNTSTAAYNTRKTGENTLPVELFRRRFSKIETQLRNATKELNHSMVRNSPETNISKAPVSAVTHPLDLDHANAKFGDTPRPRKSTGRKTPRVQQDTGIHIPAGVLGAGGKFSNLRGAHFANESTHTLKSHSTLKEMPKDMAKEILVSNLNPTSDLRGGSQIQVGRGRFITLEKSKAAIRYIMSSPSESTQRDASNWWGERFAQNAGLKERFFKESLLKLAQRAAQQSGHDNGLLQMLEHYFVQVDAESDFDCDGKAPRNPSIHNMVIHETALYERVAKLLSQQNTQISSDSSMSLDTSDVPCAITDVIQTQVAELLRYSLTSQLIRQDIGLWLLLILKQMQCHGNESTEIEHYQVLSFPESPMIATPGQRAHLPTFGYKSSRETSVKRLNVYVFVGQPAFPALNPANMETRSHNMAPEAESPTSQLPPWISEPLSTDNLVQTESTTSKHTVCGNVNSVILRSQESLAMNGSQNMAYYAYFPRFISISKDGCQLDDPRGGSPSSIAKLHADMSIPERTSEGVETRQIRNWSPKDILDFRPQLRNLGPISDALVGRRSWNSPAVLAEVGEVFQRCEEGSIEIWLEKWRDNAREEFRRRLIELRQEMERVLEEKFCKTPGKVR